MAPGADTPRRFLRRCSIFLLSPLLRLLFVIFGATLVGILADLVAIRFPRRLAHRFLGVVPDVFPGIFRSLVLVFPLLPRLVLLLARGDDVRGARQPRPGLRPR